MPFTLIHGLLGYLLAAFFTKEKRYWLLGFIAGVLPDVDGLPLLWDRQLFYAIHHELLHPLVYALLFALPAALAAKKFFKMNAKKAFAVFAAGYLLHPLADVFFTDWPVKLFWPLSNQQFSYPVLFDYNLHLALLAVLATVVHLAINFQRKKHATVGK